MTPETRVEIVRVAVRWSLNVLIEVTGNHSRCLSDEQRNAVKRAIEALGEFK